MGSYEVPHDLFSLYRDIDHALRTVDRFRLPGHLESRLESYVEYKLQAGILSLVPTEVFYRARLFSFGQTAIHPDAELGAPPAANARSGRLNPEGLPLLYVADSVTTAISETRPWVGAKLSVAKFRPKLPLRVVSLSIGIDGLHLPEPGGEGHSGFLAALAMDLNHISHPAHPDDRLSYLPTQYIAAKFRAHHVDGLAYVSALRAGGWNYALFQPEACELVSAEVFEVKSVEVEARRAA